MRPRLPRWSELETLRHRRPPAPPLPDAGSLGAATGRPPDHRQRWVQLRHADPGCNAATGGRLGLRRPGRGLRHGRTEGDPPGEDPPKPLELGPHYWAAAPRRPALLDLAHAAHSRRRRLDQDEGGDPAMLVPPPPVRCVHRRRRCGWSERAVLPPPGGGAALPRRLRPQAPGRIEGANGAVAVAGSSCSHARRLHRPGAEEEGCKAAWCPERGVGDGGLRLVGKREPTKGAGTGFESEISY